MKVPDITKRPCLSLRLEEQEWKRRVDALDTAIEIYVEKGYLHNDKNVFVRAGPKLCTTDYTSADDEIVDSEALWDEQAVYLIKIKFNMKKDNFPLDEIPEGDVKETDGNVIQII